MTSSYKMMKADAAISFFCFVLFSHRVKTSAVFYPSIRMTVKES